MAANETTYLHFDAPIDRASVEVEARTTRFKWVDVGDTLIGLKPSVDLGAEEKLVMRVRYKDGASPVAATLALVTRPAVVDREVDVVRRARTREALEARVSELESDVTALEARCAEASLPQLVFSGMLDSTIHATSVLGRMAVGYNGGLEMKRAVEYRASSWAMVVLQVSNLPGHAPWTLSTARLTHVSGTSIRVRSVHMERPHLEAGDSAFVAVMVDPHGTSGQSYRLELVDASGGLHPVNIQF